MMVIGKKARALIAASLSKLLSDTCMLALTTHNFRWNVTGPMFNTSHAMFKTPCTELRHAVNAVAERIRALGQPARARTRSSAS